MFLLQMLAITKGALLLAPLERKRVRIQTAARADGDFHITGLSYRYC